MKVVIEPMKYQKWPRIYNQWMLLKDLEIKLVSTKYRLHTEDNRKTELFFSNPQGYIDYLIDSAEVL